MSPSSANHRPLQQDKQKSCWYPFKGKHESKLKGLDSSHVYELKPNVYRMNGEANPVDLSLYHYNDETSSQQLGTAEVALDGHAMPGMLPSSDEESGSAVSEEPSPQRQAPEQSALAEINANCISRQFWTDEIVEGGCSCTPGTTPATSDEIVEEEAATAAPPTPPRQKKTKKVPYSRVEVTYNPSAFKGNSADEPRKSLIQRALCKKPERPKKTQANKEPSLARRAACSKSRSRSLSRPRSRSSCLRKQADILPPSNKVHRHVDEFIEVSATSDQLGRIKDLDDFSVYSKLNPDSNFLQPESFLDCESALVDGSQDLQSMAMCMGPLHPVIKKSPQKVFSPQPPPVRVELRREEDDNDAQPIGPPKRPSTRKEQGAVRQNSATPTGERFRPSKPDSRRVRSDDSVSSSESSSGNSGSDSERNNEGEQIQPKETPQQQTPTSLERSQSLSKDVPKHEIEISLNNIFISKMSKPETPKSSKSDQGRSKSAGRTRSNSSRLSQSNNKLDMTRNRSSHVDDLFGFGRTSSTPATDWRDDYKMFKSSSETKGSSSRHSSSKSTRSEKTSQSSRKSERTPRKKVKNSLMVVTPSPTKATNRSNDRPKLSEYRKNIRVDVKLKSTKREDQSWLEGNSELGTEAFKSFEQNDDDSVLSDLRTETGSNINELENSFESGTRADYSTYYSKSVMTRDTKLTNDSASVEFYGCFT